MLWNFFLGFFFGQRAAKNGDGCLVGLFKLALFIVVMILIAAAIVGKMTTDWINNQQPR